MLCAIAVAALFSANAEAIYKCTTAKGVVYQDRPCKEGTESDVTIVIPTGELAPKAGPAADDASQGNSGRVESRFGQPKPARAADESPSVSKGADRRAAAAAAAADAAAADEAARRDARPVLEKVLPMTAEQARKTDATAKYYTTEAAGAGNETPEHMTCESPTGEKRKFILANGKMTSI
jgi:hypothetical protein